MEFNLQKILPDLACRPVTGSAFTQARYKIQPEVFEDLNKMVSETYRISDKRLWKGHCLLAGDGSTLNLPSSRNIEDSFGIHAITDLGVKRYLARIFFIYDVLNDFVVEGRLSNMSIGEKPLLFESLESINDPNSIIILDRLFGNFCTIKELINQHRKFCIRLSCINSNFAKNMLKQKGNDVITLWKPSPKEQENANKNNLDYTPIKIRVSKINLENGEIELLVTNLYDKEKYSIEDIGELYNLRWGVEEGFKNLKPKMKIEQFGCRKSEGILQEFYAHIFCINMVSLVGNIANEQIKGKTSHRKWEYKFNWKNAYRFVREKIIKLLFLKHIGKLLDKLIAEVSCSLVPIKPDRFFPRDLKHKNKKGRITQIHK